MPVARNSRVYPLQLRSATDYPLNAGIATAYDYAGDPGNAGAGGNGTPHVGTYVLTRPTVPPVVDLGGGLLGRDLSNGKTEVVPYKSLNAGPMGLGSPDGKGNWTVWRRYRTPMSYSGSSFNRPIALYRNANSIFSIYMVESISNPWCFFFVECGTSTRSLPSSSTRTTNAAFRVPYGTIVDLHFVRDVDLAILYLNGVQAATLDVAAWSFTNTTWEGLSTNDGLDGGNPNNLILIDHTIWANRSLTSANVAQHQADPYAGYVNTASVPVTTAPAKITAPIATGGQNQVIANGTPGSNGGEVVTSYTANIYDSGSNALVKTASNSTLPVTVAPVPAGSVYSRLFATNAKGDSPLSDPSNTVTVTDPPPPPPPEPEPELVPVRYDFTASYTIEEEEAPSGITSVDVTPNLATVEGGAVRQFNVAVVGTAGYNPAVDWTATAGTVNSFGTFTAPAAQPFDQEIFVRATSVQDTSKWDESRVVILAVIPDEVTGVNVSPFTVTMQGNTQQQFQAAVSGPAEPSQEVDWTATGGTISTFGEFTAPAAETFAQTITITATSKLDARKSGTATVTVAALVVEAVQGVAVVPAVANMNGGESLQFEAVVTGPNSPSQEVTWSTNLGQITADGVVNAPEAGPREQVGTVTATSVQDPTKRGQAVFVVAAGMQISFTPSTSRQVRILPGRSAYAVGSHWTLGASGPVGPKDPNSIIDIPFDWSAWLADIGGAKLAKIEFLLGGGLQDEGAVPGIDGGTVLVSGGTPGGTGTVTCRITTATTPARTEDRTVVLQIRDQ